MQLSRAGGAHRRAGPTAHRLLVRPTSNAGLPTSDSRSPRRPRHRSSVARPAAALQAVPQQLATAAVRAAASVPLALQQGSFLLRAALDPAVFSATVGACFKLSLICAVVGWLLKTRRIPNSTATVLSQARATAAPFYCCMSLPSVACWLRLPA